jgi:hypothetical protein
MPVDHIRYDILTQDALRGLVRQVLSDATEHPLPGDHHFFITFDPRAKGVRLSTRMREQYPEEMTIVLQHQFWDLSVTEEAFEVGLSFGGIAERLRVPFDAIKSFVDPSVQFGLQFETLETDDTDSEDAEPSAAKPSEASQPSRANVPAVPVPMPLPVASSEPDAGKKPEPSAADPAGKPSGEVVRLDRFRKK